MNAKVSAGSPEFLADENVIATMRAHARWQSPCELLEEGGLILMAGQNDFPGAFRNCVARTDPTLSAAQAVTAAEAFFAERRRSFSVCVLGARDDDLEAELLARGYLLRMDTPAMLVTGPVSVPALPDDIELRGFRDEDDVFDFAGVCAAAYEAIGLDPAEVEAYFTRQEQLLAGDLIGCIAYQSGTPLSAALGIRSEGAYGIYWVGTVPGAERRGLGGACTAFITNEALARGASLVVLQATPYGEPVYQRLGFTTYNRFKLLRSPG